MDAMESARASSYFPKANTSPHVCSSHDCLGAPDDKALDDTQDTRTMVSQHPGVQRCSGGFPSHQTDLREDAVWRELAPEGGRVWYQVSSVPTKGLPHLTLCSDTPSFAARQPEAATLEGRGVGVVQGGRGWVVSARFSALGARKTQ